ncbi:putative nuclear segregation protein Bfr1 [Naematelia encephala]|uniref:Putative nuclear segregation protein Bfr1 n=1 Tax=Naematelia encephala TaxID=71784 RepID=A0A1Y2BJZ6_9TREE|nr:putative nuclear segregation protein Bfr1 [Naematelia encephala]
MPPPTSSLKPSVGKTAPKAAHANGNSNGNGNGTGPLADEKKIAGKPDQSTYNAEQDGYNKEIAAIKAKLDAVRSRISLSQAPAGNDRRSVIKSEMDALRSEQGNIKSSRQKIFDEMKRLQEAVQKKIKDVQASRGKQSYRNVAEIDERISDLDKQVESGSMKLVDEKKALQEISNLRRARKTLEATGSVDDAIAADRARIDELRKQLDDPEARKVSDKFDALKQEMDGLREEGNKAYEERNKLFEERNALSAQLDELYGKKRESALKYREENDRHWAKVQADRQARQDRYKAEKDKEDAVRREAEIAQLREEAKMPAYRAEIEDCAVLIGWFKGKYGGGEIPTTNAGGKAQTQVAGVKELEVRKVEGDFKGMTLKKKDEDEELGGFFGGSGKGKKKGKKASTSGTATPQSDSPAPSGAVNLPMSLLSALLSMGIPPPNGQQDISRTIEDLETKKAWFEANSEQKTKAEIERVEKLVKKLQKKNAILAEDDEPSAEALEDADEVDEDGGRHEPTHTVAISGDGIGKDTVEDDGLQLPTDASPNEEVKHVLSALEEIKESEDDA